MNDETHELERDSEMLNSSDVHDSETLKEIYEVEAKLQDLLPQPIQLTRDDVLNLTEDQAYQVFRATRRMMLFECLTQEYHEHNLDDCGDYLTAATRLWHDYQQALFNDDFTNIVSETQKFLQDFIDDADEAPFGPAKYPREACDGDVRYSMFDDSIIYPEGD